MTGRKRQKPKRMWWQHALRILVLAVLAATGGYIALPVWAPTGLIKRYLSAQMSQQMGVEVRIADMSLSWADGVELQELRIASPDGFPTTPMMTVQTIRTELAPIALLVHKQIEWAVLDRPRIFVHVDPAGNVNLSPLAKLRFNTHTQRISVTQAETIIRFPRQERLLKLHVRDAEYVAGRIEKLGRVTVSAELDQKGRSAPISLRLAGGTEDIVAADATFNFANVDMAQLHLPKLLGLPLRKLTGLCRGSLNLQINHQGVVDQFSFDLRIQDLDVQPTEGPKLPVIDEAGLRIAAAYDPLTGHLDVQSASMRLPGIDVAGRASLFTDIGRGRWRALKALDLEGEVHPGRLMALLTGRSELPGKLEVDGPLRIRVSASHKKTFFCADATVEGTSAAVRQTGREIKPPGRRLDMSLGIELDPRNRQLRVDKSATRLTLGDNTFSGGGTVSDIRRFVESLTGEDKPPLAKAVLSSLAMLDWEGAWEIRDFHSLRQFAGSYGTLLEPVQLQGHAAGKWSVSQFAGTQVQLDISIPSETALTVGDLFQKDDRSPLNLDVSGTIDPANPSVSRFAADLVIGEGRVSIDSGTLNFPPDEKDARTLDLAGRFKGIGVESVLEFFPVLGRFLNGRVSGQVEGSYRAELTDRLEAISLMADMKNLSVSTGRFFYKPSGHPATFSADLARDPQSEQQDRYRLTTLTDFGGATINVRAVAEEFWRPDAGLEVDAVVSIEDAQWAMDSVPLLEEAFLRGRLSGPVRLDARAYWSGRSVKGTVTCHAEQLSFATAGKIRRVKDPGVPLRLDLTGNLIQNVDRRIHAKVDKAQVYLGGSKLEFSGEGIIGRSPQSEKGAETLLPPVEALKVEGKVEVTIDDSLVQFVPELSDPIRRDGLEGRIIGSVRIRGAREQLSILSHLDAGALAAAHFRPAVAALLPEGQQTHNVKLGPFVKPRDFPAEMDLELTIPTDLSHVKLNNLRMLLGDVMLLADAKVRFKSTGSGLFGSLDGVETHIAVSVKHPETLETIAPFLKPYRINGKAFLEFQFSDDGLGERRIAAVKLSAERLTANYHNKDVLVNGEISLQDICLTRAQPPKVGRLQTDGLELRAGENHCWLIADLGGIPDQPEGEFHLIAEYLDDKDLLDWLSESLPPSTQPRSRGGEGATSQPAYRLRPEQIEPLQRRSDGLIADMRTYLARARVNGRISIERLKTFDASVGRFYEVRQAEVRISADGGDVTFAYVAGLNGGTMRTSYKFRPDEDTPVVTCETSVHDVIATDDIQPQLAKYFPGNTVYGLFNRTESSTIPLRDLVGNLLNHRYPLHPSGTAKTITTDGLLEGRAAPKFITRIFRGLNLAQYRYNKMTSFATFHPDGVAENDMVFSGRTYDIYIRGKTDAENIGRYEVGMILLGTPQSAEWNHLYRQGRIPIFKLKARIEGGKMHDEHISYPWPNETLFVIFLENNIFYRLWLASRSK